MTKFAHNTYALQYKGAACSEDEYTCENGECISSGKQCDGTSDCFNGDDELYCTTTAAVPTEPTDLPDAEMYPTESDIDGKSSQSI